MDLKTKGVVAKGLSKYPVAPRLRAIVRNADHRCRHDGLALAIEKHTGIKVDALEPGEFVLCTNSQGNMITLYGPNRVMVQQKNPHKIHDERAFRYLPQIFMQKKELSYDGALRKFLTETYPRMKAAE